MFKEIRLAFIDWHLHARGHINRSDLMERFGISQPQASNDFAEFARRFPSRMHYHKGRKQYEPLSRHAVFTPDQQQTALNVSVFFARAALESGHE